ncbi:MAG TPA: metallophosphoesterase [Chitinophagaceae bacterium]|jgi:5'-nucleotidase|nr:metallophosphoesterase [Chitinophagaceae bacterium]
MLPRRTFLRQGLLAAGGVLAGPHLASAADLRAPVPQLTILHTNDTHSRIDPFPMDGSRNQGQGGVAPRAALIREVRAEGGDVLLLDAGDIFQGTPYFNIYKGEPEIKAMSAMGYDAVTIGNHDFDAGLEVLATQVRRHARFPVVISNYDFTGTPMEDNHVPYQILKKGKLKVGLLGVGIELQGLVPEALYGNTKFLDPVRKANETAALLRSKGCDLVICLSHLGYRYTDARMSDQVLVKETEHIDLIIGGHTHTFMEKPEVLKNKNGADVVVNQVGWAGIRLGRLDYQFTGQHKKKLIQSQAITVSKKTE